MDSDADRDADRDLHELDDRADREELRQRYYGLLQELRVTLPGVQVLLAFLLVAPFTDRFAELDDSARNAYSLSLASAFGSVVCLVAPTVFHRVAHRTQRVRRLVWSVRLAVVGMGLLGLALTLALWSIVHLVYGATTATLAAGLAVAALVGVWVVLPALVRRR